MIPRRPVDWVAIVAALLALLGEAFGSYLHTDKDIEHRVSTLEQAHTDDHEAIQEIKTTVERIEQELLQQAR